MPRSTRASGTWPTRPSVTTRSGRSSSATRTRGRATASRYAASAAPGTEFMTWRLDDEVIAYPTYAVINANRAPAHEAPRVLQHLHPQGPVRQRDSSLAAPNNTPRLRQPGRHRQGGHRLAAVQLHHLPLLHPADLLDLQSLLDILNEPGSMAPTTLTDSDGHTVPNIRWSTQFAQIAGGQVRGRGGADVDVSVQPPRACPTSTRSWARRWRR